MLIKARRRKIQMVLPMGPRALHGRSDVWCALCHEHVCACLCVNDSTCRLQLRRKPLQRQLTGHLVPCVGERCRHWCRHANKPLPRSSLPLPPLLSLPSREKEDPQPLCQMQKKVRRRVAAAPATCLCRAQHLQQRHPHAHEGDQLLPCNYA